MTWVAWVFVGALAVGPWVVFARSIWPHRGDRTRATTFTATASALFLSFLGCAGIVAAADAPSWILSGLLVMVLAAAGLAVTAGYLSISERVVARRRDRALGVPLRRWRYPTWAILGGWLFAAFIGLLVVAGVITIVFATEDPQQAADPDRHQWWINIAMTAVPTTIFVAAAVHVWILRPRSIRRDEQQASTDTSND